MKNSPFSNFHYNPSSLKPFPHRCLCLCKPGAQKGLVRYSLPEIAILIKNPLGMRHPEGSGVTAKGYGGPEVKGSLDIGELPLMISITWL